MTNFLSLTKMFIRSLKMNKSNRSKKNVLLYIFIFAFIIIFLVIPFFLLYTFFVFSTMKKLNDIGFAQKGLEALLYVMSVFLLIFGFNSLLNKLFYSDDIENILPLPVKPEEIVASKFTSCYVIENILVFVFLILAVIAYIFSLRLPITYMLLSLIGIIFIPMMPMVYCTIILLLAINVLKNFMSTKTIKRIGFFFLMLLIFLVGLTLYKLSTFNFEVFLEDFATGDQTFISTMKYIFPSIHYFSLGLDQGSIIHIIISIGFSLLSFIIMLLVARYTYYDGVSGILGKDIKNKKINNNDAFKVRSPLLSYYLKDLKILFRSPVFFINSIIINIVWPIILLLMFRIALPSYTITFMKNAVELQESTFFIRMLLFVLGVSIFVPTFNSIASSSFSREGKNFHFIKYIPMKYGLQWREKFLVSFSISIIGILFFSIPFFILIKLSLIKILLYTIIMVLCVSIVSLIGLLIDSLMPKLIWEDEIDSLRENYNSFIAMGYSLLLFGLFFIGCSIAKNYHFSFSLLAIIYIVVLSLLCYILYVLSKKKISHNIINQEL